MLEKQVDKQHYRFSRYVDKLRWASMWHQIDEVLAVNPHSVLEIGPGPGVFKAVAGVFGVRVETLDIDPELNPDHVASAEAMPFPDGRYDLVCAFQMLEHVPYPMTLSIVREMSRVAKHNLIISLPDARSGWPYSLHIPKRGAIKFVFERPGWRPREHRFNGEHYWEVNTRGYGVKKVIADLSEAAGMELGHTYRVEEYPYHRFFVFNR